MVRMVSQVHLLFFIREGFGDRVAFLPQDIPQFSTNPPGDEVGWLVAFLRFLRSTITSNDTNDDDLKDVAR
jgi:hypothetical protein